MAVRLLIGKTGTGKTTFCINEIVQAMEKEPDGDPIIYLVPDQMTFLSEYRFITSNRISGMIRTQVYSFSRLAWRILQETGGMTRYHLNNVGIHMLIRKIIEDQKDQLKIFEKAADKNGFISQLEQLLTEFRRYCVHPDELRERKEDLEGDPALQQKLHDLEKIYQAFEESLLNKYIDGEDYLRLLEEKIETSNYIKKASVYIDGFHSFTPQEYQIVAQLMKHCKQVTIALTLDRPFINESPDELHLFRITGETCQTIFEMAKGEQIPIETIQFKEQLRWTHPSLNHLETYFNHHPPIPFQGEPNIFLGEGANRRAELEGIVRLIRQLVIDKGYRYRDIALLVRNTEDYENLIHTVFTDFEVPYFFDKKRSQLHHPLVELVRSTLETINTNFRYEAVFRAIKTELLFPVNENETTMREKMDRLENYVLAYGIKGEKWTSKERWTYKKYYGLEQETTVQTDAEKEVEEELNELKEMVASPIVRLSKRLKKAKDGKQLAEALYLYLEELEIPAKLEKWKIAEEEKGALEKGREHDQVWNSMIDLLDQFVEILGDKKISLNQFAKIIEAGMESMQFALVPPALDQVLIANMEKSRLANVKVAFIIGLNEGVLPAKFPNEGLLVDEDREALMTNGLKISPSNRIKILDEEFIAYHAFTMPSDRLYLSYPLADEEGKALMPSLYINRMKAMFPNISTLSFVAEPSELDEEEQLQFVSNKNNSLSHLTTQLQLKKRNYTIYDFWWDVYNHFIDSPSWKRLAMKALSSLNYENRAKELTSDLSRDLYGETISASVSRMEQFHRCPFAHFMNYGLKLKEREILRLEAPDIGELFHSALKYVVETIIKKNGSWKDVHEKELEQLAKEAVDFLAPKLQREILLSSNRHKYIKRKLEQIIERASFILKKQGEASGFAPVAVEVPFGPNKKLPPLQFSLKNGVKMELIGRIDRVDKAENEKGVFLRIIDYKSSETDLDLVEVYYGLALQMLTYLDIIIRNGEKLIGEKAHPAGVLYFHIHNPLIRAKKLLAVEEIEEEILKQFKMKGLIVNDETIIREMDRTLETGESKIVAAGINKDGTVSKRSKVATKDDFDELRKYVRKLYLKSGEKMVDGTVDIAPYKLQDRTPCKFCSYKEVCQFDESLPGNEYRMLTKESPQTILDWIRKGEQ